MKSGKTRLIGGRDIRRLLDALAVCDGIGADRARSHLVDGVGELIDDHIDLARDKIVQCGPGATVRHILQGDVGRGFESKAGDVTARARTSGAGGGRLRPRLQPCQQLRQRFRRNSVLADDDHGIARQQHYRLQIVDEVAAKLVDRAVGDVGAETAEAHGVAVGRRVHDAADADGAAGACGVLHQDRLAKRRLHALGENSHHRIRRTAGGKRHHDSDGVGGEFVGERVAAKCR